MATRAARDLPDDLSRVELPAQSLAGGVDGWLTLDDAGVWAMRGYFTASQVQGNAAAIDALQRSSRRYLQRPDAAHVDYDPNRTSLRGWAGRAMLNKQKGAWTLNTALGATSPGYEVSDLGFQSRSDRINYHLAVGRNWEEPGKIFRWRGVSLTGFQTWDFGGRPNANGTGIFTWNQFANYWRLNAQFFVNPEANDVWATRGGPSMLSAASWSTWVGVETDSRKNLVIESGFSQARGVDGSATTAVRVSFTVRPRSSLRLSLSPRIEHRIERAQYVGQQEDPVMTATHGARYLFAAMDYRSASFTTRVDWTLTPRLTLQTFLQPLFAVASYRDIKELARPDSRAFNTYGRDGNSSITYDTENGEYLIDPDPAAGAESFSLSDPDFNFKSLKVNMVLRWEYRQGSTFFFVWTQDRANFDDPGSFDLGRDAGALFAAPGENIFMVKMAHWFDT
jgi:hypothetical protein